MDIIKRVLLKLLSKIYAKNIIIGTIITPPPNTVGKEWLDLSFGLSTKPILKKNLLTNFIRTKARIKLIKARKIWRLL